MFAKSIVRPIRTLSHNFAELFKLQALYYFVELKRSRRAVLLMATLAGTILVLFFAGSIIALLSIAWALTTVGLSMPLALLITAVGTFAVIAVLSVWAYSVVRARLQSFVLPNQEFKQNLSLLRSQFFNPLPASNHEVTANLITKTIFTV